MKDTEWLLEGSQGWGRRVPDSGTQVRAKDGGFSGVGGVIRVAMRDVFWW